MADPDGPRRTGRKITHAEAREQALGVMREADRLTAEDRARKAAGEPDLDWRLKLFQILRFFNDSPGDWSWALWANYGVSDEERQRILSEYEDWAGSPTS